MQSELLCPWEAMERSCSMGRWADEKPLLFAQKCQAERRWLGQWWQVLGSARLQRLSRYLVAGHQDDMWQVWPFHMADSIPDWLVLHSNQIKFSLFLRRKHIPVTPWQLQHVQSLRDALSSLSWAGITGVGDSLIP